MVKSNRGTDSHEDCKFNRLSVLQSFFPPHVYRLTRHVVGKSERQRLLPLAKVRLYANFTENVCSDKSNSLNCM